MLTSPSPPPPPQKSSPPIFNEITVQLFHFSGELLCTRLRCFSSDYNYINYQMLFGKQYTPGDPQKAMMNERLVRGKDPCMECDDEPVAPVCGPNWKTYRSMCHALRCGRFTVDDVKGGKCGGLVSALWCRGVSGRFQTEPRLSGVKSLSTFFPGLRRSLSSFEVISKTH